MSTEVTTPNSTLARMRCFHGMPTPAACVDCMDEGVFLPKQARRAGAGQLTAGGTVALVNDCSVQAIAAALGADYLEAAEALAAAGWVPGQGATEAQIRAAVVALGFELAGSGLSLDAARRDGGTFIVVGYRGRRGHAWTIDAGRYVNALGWDLPARVRTTFRVLRVVA